MVSFYNVSPVLAFKFYLLKFSIAKFGFKYVSLISVSMYKNFRFYLLSWFDSSSAQLWFLNYILSILRSFMPQFLYLSVSVSLCFWFIQFTSRFSIVFWFVIPNSTILYGLDRCSCVSPDFFFVYLSMNWIGLDGLVAKWDHPQTGTSDVKFKQKLQF